MSDETNTKSITQSESRAYGFILRVINEIREDEGLPKAIPGWKRKKVGGRVLGKQIVLEVLKDFPELLDKNAVITAQTIDLFNAEVRRRLEALRK